MKELTRREVLIYGTSGIAALSLSNLLSACASTVSKSTKEIDTLNVGLSSAVTNLDPALQLAWQTCAVDILGCERLIQPSDSGELLPWLATSWTNPDNLTWVFQIRKGVKFWDGTPMTVDDVVFSLNRAAASTSQAFYYFSQVKSMEATGANEVTAHMNTPFPLFVNGLTYAPVYSKQFALAQGMKFGTPAGATVTVMGTGPFKFTSFSDTGVTAVRNDEYWGQKPPIKNVNVQFISDAQTLQLAFRSGSVDWVPYIALDQAPQWQEIPRSKVVFSPPMTSVFLAFNVNKPPFNDVHVRRAVAHCCNTTGMVSALLHGHGEAATAIVPPAMWGTLATPDQVRGYYQQMPQYPFDLSLARQELAESTSPSGFTATIQIPQVNSFYEEAALAISQNLKSIGCTLTVQSVPTNEWNVNAYSAHNQLIYWFEYLPDYANPADYATTILLSLTGSTERQQPLRIQERSSRRT